MNAPENYGNFIVCSAVPRLIRTGRTGTKRKERFAGDRTAIVPDSSCSRPVILELNNDYKLHLITGCTHVDGG